MFLEELLHYAKTARRQKRIRKRIYASIPAGTATTRHGITTKVTGTSGVGYWVDARGFDRFSRCSMEVTYPSSGIRRLVRARADWRGDMSREVWVPVKRDGTYNPEGNYGITVRGFRDGRARSVPTGFTVSYLR